MDLAAGIDFTIQFAENINLQVMNLASILNL